MKLKFLQKVMKKENVDACLLFYSDPNFSYFFEQETDDGFLLITKKGNPILFINPLGDINTPYKKIIFKKLSSLENFFEKRKIKVLGINESQVSIKQKKTLSKFVKLKHFEYIFSNLRKIKTKDEIKKIQKACLLTELIFKKIVDDFYFKYENDIREFIKIQAIKLNCKLSFEPIVASGKNASIPHYSENSRIKKGFLVIDCGLKYKGYCADITRTIYIGKPSSKEKQIYNNLLEVQKQAIKMLKPSLKISSVEKFVRKKLGSNNKYFIHSLGHGLGVEVHELPGVGIRSKGVFLEGMIITIEPGIYNGFGIRIEDDVLITDKSAKLLTKYNKNLIIIPKV